MAIYYFYLHLVLGKCYIRTLTAGILMTVRRTVFGRVPKEGFNI